MQSQKIGVLDVKSNNTTKGNETYLNEKKYKDDQDPVVDNEDPQSFYSVWKLLRDSTTLHGIKHVSTEVSVFHGLFWGILTFAMLFSLIALLVISGKEYHSYPTLTKVDLQKAKELELPEITICNVSPFNRSVTANDSAFQNFLLLNSNMRVFVNGTLNLSDPFYSSLSKERDFNWLRRTSFRIKHSFVVCILFGDKRNCEDVFEERITDSGLCFNFNGPSLKRSLTTNYIGSNLGLTIYMTIDQEDYVLSENMAAGIKVVVHPKGTEPNVIDNSFLVGVGSATYVSLHMVKRTFQPLPFVAFGHEVCEETKHADFRNPLVHFPNYSYYACVRECRARFIFEKCKCRMIVDRGSEKVCSPAEEYECAIPNTNEFNGNSTLQTSCNCRKPCEEIEYEKEISYAHFPADVYADVIKHLGIDNVSKNYLELRVYFGSMFYKTVAQVPKLTLDRILANFGGFMGIFLGASILTLMEFIEAGLLMVIIAIKRIFSKENKK